MKKLILILGNQLFDPLVLKDLHPPSESTGVFMREDAELCTYYQFHKHKLVFFLSAMRTHADELKELGYQVHYERLADSSAQTYDQALLSLMKAETVTQVIHYEIEDKFFETRLKTLFSEVGVQSQELSSPMFLTGREKFTQYLQSVKQPQLRTFYERQRKDLKLLVDPEGKPLHGQWSFDEDNRKPLPKSVTPPPVPTILKTKHVTDVEELVENHFAGHPGKSRDFWLPVSRTGARAWLQSFLKERLDQFGPFEDALPQRSDFVFHSVLTPFLNTGLLTPSEIAQGVLKETQKRNVPFSSVEGFLRQIIGWREFVRGIYQNFSEGQETTNFWKHQGKLTDAWYDATTGVPPLDNVIQKANRYAYAHHIERLMVVGNLMLLSGVAPAEGHRWFMEMFIDSSDWVMGPNVYGMALFSDGGIFATKPYVCGSNYLLKMSGLKKADWCDGVDGLYWGFIEKHRAFFLMNHRTSNMVWNLERLAPDRKKTLFSAAEKLRSVLVK